MKANPDWLPSSHSCRPPLMWQYWREGIILAKRLSWWEMTLPLWVFRWWVDIHLGDISVQSPAAGGSQWGDYPPEPVSGVDADGTISDDIVPVWHYPGESLDAEGRFSCESVGAGGQPVMRSSYWILWVLGWLWGAISDGTFLLSLWVLGW